MGARPLLSPPQRRPPLIEIGRAGLASAPVPANAGAVLSSSFALSLLATIPRSLFHLASYSPHVVAVRDPGSTVLPSLLLGSLRPSLLLGCSPPALSIYL
ncbi:hypothetical protein BD310DRAFT_181912 [Dichomitus squalens]|uniref:Uncharacterized protein n=1 Tax=Dichomitus squalens TaxID=114155 RepID=A0A4Q9PDX5_9APHY|nr:hypothetical protein BD310DRAFT_181912 [Dichomitus squalens]